MKKINNLFLPFLIVTLLYSCSQDDECSSPVLLSINDLESEYGCVNTKYQMDVDLVDDYTIIRSQQSFNDLVTGDCNPEIDFLKYDLLIGKKALTSGNKGIAYTLTRNSCSSNQLYLNVDFNQNETAEAPNLTYHILISKLRANEEVNVSFSISYF